MYIFRELQLFADKLPRMLFWGTWCRRERRNFFPGRPIGAPGWRSAPGLPAWRPARYAWAGTSAGMGRVQQEIGAGFVGLGYSGPRPRKTPQPQRVNAFRCRGRGTAAVPAPGGRSVGASQCVALDDDYRRSALPMRWVPLAVLNRKIGNTGAPGKRLFCFAFQVVRAAFRVKRPGSRV